jgi:hypothetical protein
MENGLSGVSATADHDNFLRRFLMLKKLRHDRPGARPVRDMPWRDCFHTRPDGRLMLWFDAPLANGLITTGITIEGRK